MIKISVPQEFHDAPKDQTLYVTARAAMNPHAQKSYKQRISLHNWEVGQELWVEPWTESVTFSLKTFEKTINLGENDSPKV